MKKMLIVIGVCWFGGVAVRAQASALMPAWFDGIQDGDRTGSLEAEAIVRLSVNGQSGLINIDLVNELLQSTALIGAAAEDVLHAPPESAGTAASVELLEISREEEMFGDRLTLMGRFRVDLDANMASDGVIRGSADEFLVAVADRLRRTLARAYDESTQPVVARVEQLRTRTEELARETFALRDQIEALRKSAGYRELFRDQLMAQLADLQSEADGAELELFVQRAHREAVERQIAEIGKEVQGSAALDEIARELERVVQLRETEVARMMKLKDMTATAGEASQAEERLAMARVELLRHREELTRDLGGQMLPEFNHELRRLAIAEAELQARMQMLELRRGKITALLDLCEDYERKSEALSRLEERLDRTRQLEGELAERLETAAPPSFVLIQDKPE